MPRAVSGGQVLLRGLQEVKVWAARGEARVVRRARERTMDMVGMENECDAERPWCS